MQKYRNEVSGLDRYPITFYQLSRSNKKKKTEGKHPFQKCKPKKQKRYRKKGSKMRGISWMLNEDHVMWNAVKLPTHFFV